ncbi:MAG: RdgB/HAM1 family non-canonical purine NTP pyrophosphatase [Alphaproteobacteria bacterium]|nr:RdgB/HAM1 family non-canonical purine NTP pyrophosphatase [Alphaproteobacteria bacterium]
MKIPEINKIILLVGLMGSGKTSVGKRLARKLSLPFVDGDAEIEKAAGLSLVDVLKCFGEAEYRAGEERVMKRLLKGAPCVLASGGGSFVAEQTRALAKENALTVWLKADINTLYHRTAGRTRRPFLLGDNETVKHKLQEYITEEYPYYSEADIVVETRDERVEYTVRHVIAAINNYYRKSGKKTENKGKQKMKIKELVFASHNAGKIAEIKQILTPLGISVKSAADMNLPDVAETGTTFAENSLLKSQTIAKAVGLPCIADDSGLCVDALNGAPGVYSARYAPDRDFDKGMDKLLNQMEQSADKSRKAHFSCVVSLAFPNGEYKLFEGRVDGTIATAKMTGTEGFGYDPLFVPDGYNISFAQMEKSEKNKISHRGRAMQKFKDYLASL